MRLDLEDSAKTLDISWVHNGVQMERNFQIAALAKIWTPVVSIDSAAR